MGQQRGCLGGWCRQILRLQRIGGQKGMKGLLSDEEGRELDDFLCGEPVELFEGLG